MSPGLHAGRKHTPWGRATGFPQSLSVLAEERREKQPVFTHVISAELHGSPADKWGYTYLVDEKVGLGKTGLSKIRSLYLVRKAESFLVPSASKAHELSTGTHRLPGGYFTEVYASRS